MKRISIFIAALFLLSSCVTGGFDENPQMDDVQAALAKAPKVTAIIVNGVELERNSASVRRVDAHPGDVLSIEAELASGKSAVLDQLEVGRQYYWADPDPTILVEAPHPLDPLSDDGLYVITGKESSFSYEYTVPVEDDDGFEFHPGNKIYVYFKVKNTLDNFGFKAFEIHFVE